MKQLLIMLSLIAGLASTACTQDPIKSKEQLAMDINVVQFQEMTASNPGIILDVRTAGEVSQGAIKGSKNIDFYSEDFMEQVSQLDKSKPIYIYCASGGRSSEAMSKMSDAGFRELYNLKGGYRAWSAKAK
jgi:rhodanese-related sulfurtransferase